MVRLIARLLIIGEFVLNGMQMLSGLVLSKCCIELNWRNSYGTQQMYNFLCGYPDFVF